MWPLEALGRSWEVSGHSRELQSGLWEGLGGSREKVKTLPTAPGAFTKLKTLIGVLTLLVNVQAPISAPPGYPGPPARFPTSKRAKFASVPQEPSPRFPRPALQGSPKSNVLNLLKQNTLKLNLLKSNLLNQNCLKLHLQKQ